MTPKQKKLLYVVLGLVFLVGAYMAYKKWFKNPATITAGSTLTYTESDVTKQMDQIKSDAAWKKNVQDKATAQKRTFDEQLRLDAVYTLEVLQGRKKA